MPIDLFGKPPTSLLTVEDLQRLITNGTREGYDIEYKESPKPPKDMARALCSLANTFGGWYFVGIDDDEHDAATALTGYSQSAYPDRVSSIRNVARDSISPRLRIYPQTIQIDPTDPDRVVLAVFVPEGQDSPFITTEGIVYYRNHASSEPLKVTDRLIMDQIIERGRSHLTRFTQFCRDERSFGIEFEPGGMVSLFFWPYPLGMIDRPDIVEQTGIADIISRSKSTGVASGRFHQLRQSADLQYGHPSIQSSVFRGRTEDPPPGAVFSPRWVSMELFSDGRAKIHIPLRYFDLHPTTLQYRIHHSHLQDVLESAFERNILNIDTKFVDLLHLWDHTGRTISLYLDWLGDAANDVEIRFGLEINHVWNHAAIADKAAYGTHVGRSGIPVLGIPSIRIPREGGWGGVIPSSALPAVRLLCEWQGLAFGIPSIITSQLFEEVNFKIY